MLKKFTVLPGHSFRLPDGSLVEAGGTVELPSDVAASHAMKVAEIFIDQPLPPLEEPRDQPGFTPRAVS